MLVLIHWGGVAVKSELSLGLKLSSELGSEEKSKEAFEFASGLEVGRNDCSWLPGSLVVLRLNSGLCRRRGDLYL